MLTSPNAMKSCKIKEDMKYVKEMRTHEYFQNRKVTDHLGVTNVDVWIIFKGIVNE
jgi:hypothetical protein